MTYYDPFLLFTSWTGYLKGPEIFFLNNVQMKMVHSPISSDTENIL